MRWKDFIFCLSVICLVFLIGKIPLQDILENSFVAANAKGIRDIVIGSTIILACQFIAKSKKILILGGFLKPNKKNYWMLFLPLFFPGLMLVFDFNFGCYSGFISIIISILAILMKGLMEEVIFRGVIQGYLIKQYPGKAYNGICFISATFFALVHLVNIQYSYMQGALLQVIYAFYMGLLFGALIIKINNIWLLGIVHGVLNIFSVRCEEMNNIVHGVNNYSSSAFDFSGLLGVLVIFSPILIIYWFLIKTSNSRKL